MLLIDATFDRSTRSRKWRILVDLIIPSLRFRFRVASSCTWLYLHRTPFPLRNVNIISPIISIVCADWGVASQCETRARPLGLSGDRERCPAARKGIFTVQLLAISLIQFTELFDFYRGGGSFILTFSILPKEYAGYSRRSHRRTGTRKEP